MMITAALVGFLGFLLELAVYAGLGAGTVVALLGVAKIWRSGTRGIAALVEALGWSFIAIVSGFATYLAVVVGGLAFPDLAIWLLLTP